MAFPPNTLSRITEHTFWYSPDARTDRPSLGAVSGHKATLLLDAGASPTHTAGFLNALSGHAVPAPRFAALTHWHWDHTFGASALAVPVIAQRGTAAQLRIQAGYAWTDAAIDDRVRDGLEVAFCRDMLKLEIPDRSSLQIALPDVLFDDRLTVDLGAVTCEIVHVGGDHSPDSTVIHVPQDRVLFVGDALYYTVYTLPNQYTAEKTLPMLDKLEALDADHFIMGHQDTVLNRDEFYSWVYNLRTLAALTQRLGADRDALLAAFQSILGRELTDDDREDAESFLMGCA